MEKLNIAEILKNCPKGMELDSTIVNGLYFDEVTGSNMIKCYTKRHDKFTSTCNSIYFYPDGSYLNHIRAKCVIFPKGKTTWEGFQRPFKDGDIAISDRGDIHLLRTADSSYCAYRKNFRNPLDKTITTGVVIVRLATEEEKKILFDVIKANGYKWNAETKTLEKLIVPKFKVGDRVKNKDGYVIDIIEVDTNNERYTYKTPIGAIGDISFNNQNNYELVPNKFDITTLKPFESRVLVRTNDRRWVAAFYSHYDKDSFLHHCVLGGLWYEQCIPYNGNEHLLNTNNDCDDYYKTWE